MECLALAWLWALVTEVSSRKQKHTGILRNAELSSEMSADVRQGLDIIILSKQSKITRFSEKEGVIGFTAIGCLICVVQYQFTLPPQKKFPPLWHHGHGGKACFGPVSCPLPPFGVMTSFLGPQWSSFWAALEQGPE
jgi:hypothetical protein